MTIDIVYLVIVLACTLFIMGIGRLIWIERPHRRKRPRGARLDISCPDCGLDPHTPGCRFAWMGPPPTSFTYLQLPGTEQESEQHT